MKHWIEYSFCLGDLGEHYGFAEGYVEVDRWGRTRTTVTKAHICMMSPDGLSKLDVNALPFLDTCTRLDICERLEAEEMKAQRQVSLDEVRA